MRKRHGVRLGTAILFAICTVFCSCGETGNRRSVSAEESYFSAVESYSRQDFEEARKLARKALEEDRNLYRAEILLGKISFFSREYEEASVIFRGMLRKLPECTDAKLWLCRVLVATEKQDEAERLLLEETMLNSRDWRVYYLLSLVYAGRGMLEKQLSYLEYAELMLEESSSVYRDMGMVWQTLGVQEKATDYQIKYAYLFDREK